VSKLFFTIAVKCLFLLPVGVGQDIGQTLGLATEYRERGMFEAAARHYRRVIFFGSDSLQAATFPFLAECQIMSGNYGDAVFYYGLAANTAASDSLKSEYIYMRVLAHLLNEEPGPALQQLLSVPGNDSPYFRGKSNFYFGVIHLQRQEGEAAREYFMEATGDSTALDRISKLFDESALDHPDPVRAKRLSMFLPGLGQAYAGDPRGALNSFILVGALGALAGYTAVHYSLLEGFLSVVPWLTRYYLGGSENAWNTARQIRTGKHHELLQELIRIFEEEQH
jgi:tetratricopeptide (TPR) repeat protein